MYSFIIYTHTPRETNNNNINNTTSEIVSFYYYGVSQVCICVIIIVKGYITTERTFPYIE